MARPTDYTPELASKICEQLAEGKSLRTVCLADDMPDKSTVFNWFRKFPEFVDQYARAKEESAEAHNELLLDLGDEAISLSQEVDPKSSSAVVQAVKLKADNLKWVMSKMKPKKYGDKVDVTSDVKVLPTPIFSLDAIRPNDSDQKDSTTDEED